MTDYDTTLEFLLDCARGAGRIVMQYVGQVPEIRDKGRLDLVTRADFESEQYLIDRIAERFPDHAVHGEERGAVARAAYNWTVDPLAVRSRWTEGTATLTMKKSRTAMKVAVRTTHIAPEPGSPDGVSGAAAGAVVCWALLDVTKAPDGSTRGFRLCGAGPRTRVRPPDRTSHGAPPGNQ